MPPAGNWVCFACSIPPLFVLSHSLPMVNTMGKLALFWRFFSHRQLGPFGFTDHSSLAPRPTPGPAGSGRAQTLPRWPLPDTDHRIVKDRTGPDLDERVVCIEYVTEPGDSFGQIKLFLPTRRRSTVDHSLIARGAQCLWLRSCLADGRGRGRLTSIMKRVLPHSQ